MKHKMTVMAEVVLKVGKKGIIKKYVRTWVADALQKQADREGWGSLLDVKVVKVEEI
jgi:hypothetical protein